MTYECDQDSARAATVSRRNYAAPILTLLILSPVLAEVLFGMTRISTIFVLIPQVGTWGCAALIIREIARRRGQGWGTILGLGIAVALAEECLIQQTSLAPLVGVDPAQVYGRALGVNWVYLLWALGYESVWTVVLPIMLTELIFPDRRHEPWLGRRGLAIAAVCFLLASFVAWYMWTQVLVPKLFPESVYQVPMNSLAIAAAFLLAVVIGSLSLPRTSHLEPVSMRIAPRPWVVGIAAFLVAAPWFGLVFLAYGATPALPVVVPLVLGLVWVSGAFVRFRDWSARRGWNDRCRLASIVGALFASMLAGFPIVRASGAPLMDVIGEVAFDGIAIVLLVAFGRLLAIRDTQKS